MSPELDVAQDVGDFNQSEELTKRNNGKQEHEEDIEKRAQQEAQLHELQVWCAHLLQAVVACKEALLEQEEWGTERQLQDLQVWWKLNNCRCVTRLGHKLGSACV